jgi:hypothetical protein
MTPFFPQPTHYTARRTKRAAGIKQTIKEFSIGIHG